MFRLASAGIFPPETTGKWVAAKFEHDSARPVDGYAAPQLHTHVVFFNLTETADGETHALQPRELYKTQQYATAVYRSELATRLRDWATRSSAGRAASRKSKATAKSILRHRVRAASRSRSIWQRRISEELALHKSLRTKRAKPKLDLSHEEMQQRHRQMAEAFGNQPERVVAAARERAQQIEPEAPHTMAQSAVTFSKERNLEREAVVEERELSTGCTEAFDGGSGTH